MQRCAVRLRPVGGKDRTAVSAAEDEATGKTASGTQDQKFGEALWDAYLLGVLPDGGGLDYEDEEIASENSFAVFDVDRDGIIYYLLSPDWWTSWREDNVNDEDENEKMVDGSEYESWRQSYLGDGKLLSVPVKALTEENIAALGCPKPEISPGTEPVG